MITHITYKEAQFKGSAAADAAIALAEERGWEVSDSRFVGDHVIVTFRQDQDCTSGLDPERLELPAFDFGQTRHLAGAGFMRRIRRVLTTRRVRTARQEQDVRQYVRRV